MACLASWALKTTMGQVPGNPVPSRNSVWFFQYGASFEMLFIHAVAKTEEFHPFLSGWDQVLRKKQTRHRINTKKTGIVPREDASVGPDGGRVKMTMM